MLYSELDAYESLMILKGNNFINNDTGTQSSHAVYKVNWNNQ